MTTRLDMLIRFHQDALTNYRFYMSPSAQYLANETIEALEELKKCLEKQERKQRKEEKQHGNL